MFSLYVGRVFSMIKKGAAVLLPLCAAMLTGGCAFSASSSATDTLTIASCGSLAMPSYKKNGNAYIFVPSATEKTGVTLSGRFDGYLEVDGTSLSDHKSVEFDLNGVTLTANEKPTLYFNSLNSKMIVNVLKGSSNSITYNGTGDKLGAIFSENNLDITGDGSLSVTTTMGHAFRGDDLTFSGSSTIDLSAGHDGVHGKTLTMTNYGGALTMGTVGSEAFDVCDDDSASGTYSGFVKFPTSTTYAPVIKIEKCLSVIEADNSFSVTSPMTISCVKTTGSLIENINKSPITMTVEGNFTANGEKITTQEIATKK